MSILIKGMEMPKDCIFCPMFRGAWTMCAVLNKTTSVKGRPEDCPLVPVPPHGDLIDYDFCMKNYELLHDDDGNPVYAVRMRDINNAPTIIPASGGAEDE